VQLLLLVTVDEAAAQDRMLPGSAVSAVQGWLLACCAAAAAR